MATSAVAASAELLRLWRAVEGALAEAKDGGGGGGGAELTRAREALEAMARVDGVSSGVLRTTGLGVKMRPLR